MTKHLGRTRLMRWTAACLGIATSMPMPGSRIHATAAEVEQVGFGGVYRTGSWTPLVVRLDEAEMPAGGTIRASVEEPDGQWLASPPTPVTVGEDGRARARFCVRFGRPIGRVTVHPSPTVDANQPLLLPEPLPATDTIILVCGELAGMDRAARLMAREDGSRPRVVPAPRDEGLAAGPRDLDGADVVVMTGRDAGERDRPTLEAIDDWIRQGGHLILAAGSAAADLAAADGPARTWLPGPVSRMVPLRRSAPLEVFARCTRPMDRSLLAGLEVPVFENATRLDGVVDAFDGAKPSDLPLVVRRSHGLGSITWIGIDLDRPGFRSWIGTETLLVELLGGQPPAQAGRAGETSRLSLDLAGQLRRAIDRFAGVAPVPFSTIALLGALAIATLYPLSWWMVRQSVPAMAWSVLPVVALATAGAVWETGKRWRSAHWEESTASLIDIDAASGLVRGSTWAGVWSPENGSFDISVGPVPALGAAGVEAAVSWYADAGRGLGATDAPVAHPSLAAGDYPYGPTPATLLDVPIAAASSRLFEAGWVGQLPEPAVTATLTLEAQGTLRGTVAHHLPFVLEDCVLVHAGWLYHVGRLAPAEAFDPSAGRGPRSLASALTRRTQNKDRDVVLRWDTSTTDVTQILEIAGFHAAAGGSGYTSLEAGRLGRLDLSPQLEVGRAVLVGRGPPGTAWSFGGGPRDDATSSAPTLWRILIALETRAERARP